MPIYYMESGSKHKVKYEFVFELTGDGDVTSH